MKNKAFTLIELIMVITLLGIIALIAIPAINNSLNKSKDEASTAQKKIIIDAAKTYMSNYSEKLPKSSCSIKISTLNTEGLLNNSEIKDAKTKEVLNGVVEVSYDNNKNKYTYTYKNSDNNSDNNSEC